jgi:hypothetical protein
VSRRAAEIGSAIALALGAVALIALLLALLDMARMEGLQQGAEFQRAATNLRLTVVGEVIVLLATVAVVIWRVTGRTAQIIVVACAVWILAFFDFVIVGAAGAIPR